jgi:nucleotide-binding universal stress UspA family protein
MLNHILVPLDESELSERALPYARHSLAAGGTLTLLCVIDLPPLPYMLSPGPYPVPVENNIEDYERMVKQLSEKARDYLQKAGQAFHEDGYQVKLQVVAGRAAESILSVAEETQAEMIVMSTHGRSGVGRWMFGSVTQKVLHSATCPVLVVPPPRKGKHD